MTNLPENLQKHLSTPLDEIPKELFSNRDFVIALASVVIDDDTFYNRIAKPFKQDIDIVKVLLRHDHVSLENYKNFSASPDIIEAAMAGNPNNIDFVPTSYKKKREWVLPFVQEEGFVYRYISDYYPKDIELARIAAQTYPSTLVFASPDITKDKEVALACVGTDSNMVSFMHASLRKDRDIALAVAKCERNSYAMSLFSKEILDDDTIMHEAVKNCTLAVSAASERIRSDLDFMIKVIRKDVKMATYASDFLQNNTLFAYEVINIDPSKWNTLGNDIVSMLNSYINRDIEPLKAIESLLLYQELQQLPKHDKNIPKNKI